MGNQDRPTTVNDSVTPTTKQPVPSVRADKWQQMNIGELHEQRSILQSRLFAAQGMGNHSLIMQVQQGLDRIDAILQTKDIGETLI